MSDGRLHVVIGTGAVGTKLAELLAERGDRVRVVSRGGSRELTEPIEQRRADAADVEAATAAVEGADVIYHCAMPPYDRWPELFPPLQRSITTAAERVGAKLVVFDNLYAYAHDPGAPITESTPERPTTKKGRVRQEMADELREAHAAGRVRATIGRASNYYGPRGGQMSPLGDRVVPNVLAGKGASVLGDPDLPHTYSYIGDIAAGLITLGDDDEALGETWHLPNAETVSTRALIELMYAAAGTSGTVSKVPRLVIRGVALFNPLVRETVEMLYEYDEPFVVDSSRFTSAFGIAGTPLAEAAAATVDWYRTKGTT